MYVKIVAMCEKRGINRRNERKDSERSNSVIGPFYL